MKPLTAADLCWLRAFDRGQRDDGYGYGDSGFGAAGGGGFDGADFGDGDGHGNGFGYGDGGDGYGGDGYGGAGGGYGEGDGYGNGVRDIEVLTLPSGRVLRAPIAEAAAALLESARLLPDSNKQKENP